MAVLAAWGLLSGWRQPEPGTWEHAVISLLLGILVLATFLLSHRQWKRLERLKRNGQRQSAMTIEQARAMAAEADRLLPRARAGYAQRQKMRDQRT